MKEKLPSLTLAAIMAFSLVGCRGVEPAATEAPTTNTAPTTTAVKGGEVGAAEETEIEAPAADFKIGIVTGTASQGDEEITQTNKMKEKYDGMIVTSTYPGDFSTKTETVISNAVATASDPAVKAVIRCQAIPGIVIAINKVRETRPDMIFIADTPGEDPGVINPKADIILQVDEPGCGIVIPPQAKAQGTKAVIHYSFPRHMNHALIVARHEDLKRYCAGNGIKLVGVTAPDPTDDSGITGARQFILGGVPRQVEKCGKDTVSFTANCGVQEPLIRSAFEQGAIYSLQCHPSSSHAFPAALDIGMAGHEVDVDYILDQPRAKVDKAGMNEGVPTWGIPCDILSVEAGVGYAKKVLERQADGVILDDQVLRDTLQECVDEIQMTIDNYVDDSGNTKDSHYLVMADFATFE